MHTTLFYRIKDIITKTGASWDQLAPTEESAIEYAHRYINPEPERMIDVHHYSMEYCLAYSGETINERFRKDRPITIDHQISDMVSQHKTTRDLVLYRGVCEAVYQMMKDNASDIHGTDLLEKSFLQTSLVKGKENHSKIHLRIYVPAGTKAVYLGNVNNEQSYYEVDLQHGAHLQIISIDKEYINCKLLKTA
ncbi:ADP-ribosyltransferase exoenzyme [Butyrivibrio fibrisolvens DSM 3071]|uniref:ADP-ribosyltransferase exoenzyme n=1 Tax=Butyrivibrio fibrisolvens DSM 3071 TaxID=1121131 RepID=A0A1M6FGV2_BUTFI|nr:ADP-ribosyltransferase [Butyrivibrio fibrisolvens]SHI96859.1 ADP-ribosyltransferase exoenzyme [Butyrivibrio fibrisolvens DSM 3071]